MVITDSNKVQGDMPMHKPKINKKTIKMTKGNLPIYSEERYKLELAFRQEKKEKA